jgi:hypothetical protein
MKLLSELTLIVLLAKRFRENARVPLENAGRAACPSECHRLSF